MTEQSSFNQGRYEGAKAVGIVLVAIFAIVVIAGMVYGASSINIRQRSTVLPANTETKATIVPSPTVTAIPTVPATNVPTEIPVVIPTEVPQTMISPTLPPMVTVTVSPAGQSY